MSEHTAMGAPSKHAIENTLECYIFNTLPEEEKEAIEIHLLTCELCRMTLASLEEEIKLLRLAFQHDELERRKKAARDNSAGKLIMFKLPSVSGS
jgi:hypothetical protein